LKGLINFELINVPKNEKEEEKLLNNECGAEFVQTQKKFPLNSDKIIEKNNDFYISSFDGDGDRLILSYYKKNKFNLIDGDKITSLIGMFFSYILKKLKLEKEISLGVVQTAYANGNSTNFLNKFIKKENIALVATGVKFLHHQAKGKFQSFKSKNMILVFILK
jgi:phosphoacetylglucosamine mutase